MKAVRFGFLALWFGFGANLPAAGPNVLFIMSDDLRPQLGCYGDSVVKTPHLDAFAKRSLRFDNAYATCHVCSPSRASILTGKYPARTNLTEWLNGRPERNFEKLHSAKKLMSLPDEEITLTETLKQHGYATADFGKAHLRKDPKSYGFDEAITGWVRSYYHPFSRQYEKTLPAQKGDYFTDKLTDAALDFIELEFAKALPKFIEAYNNGFSFGKKNK